jgi:hypothetical protein
VFNYVRSVTVQYVPRHPTVLYIYKGFENKAKNPKPSSSLPPILSFAPFSSPILLQQCLAISSRSGRSPFSVLVQSVRTPRLTSSAPHIHAPAIIGKSSLIIQFIENHFVDSYYPTIESTFSKSVNYKGIEYDCDIIDTAGQVRTLIRPFRPCG